MRLIDADAFFNDFPELKNYEHASQEYEVDAEPVKHGHWVDDNTNYYYANCSICGYEIDVHVNRGYHNYCPNCGAKMDEVEE